MRLHTSAATDDSRHPSVHLGQVVRQEVHQVAERPLGFVHTAELAAGPAEVVAEAGNEGRSQCCTCPCLLVGWVVASLTLGATGSTSQSPCLLLHALNSLQVGAQLDSAPLGRAPGDSGGWRRGGRGIERPPACLPQDPLQGVEQSGPNGADHELEPAEAGRPAMRREACADPGELLKRRQRQRVCTAPRKRRLANGIRLLHHGYDPLEPILLREQPLERAQLVKHVREAAACPVVVRLEVPEEPAGIGRRIE
mmetsp:Transcript_76645/g.242344  ORF Transcript_76645/g.242344 Transcript_76645/m.242344 type:complete len:253 (+) Transcript_76645:541-1299(+)